MSSVVSGIIGGAVAVLLTSYIAKRVGRDSQPGRLRFGLFMWGLAFACLAFAIFPIVVTVFYGHEKEFWAKTALFLGFAVAAIYCFGEAALVRGSYDQEGIEFSTPWTGAKREKWQDLVSVKLNDWCSWYTLTFRSGKKIRLSRYLSGHLAALDVVESRGEF